MAERPLGPDGGRERPLAAEALFERFFAPLYPKGDLASLDVLRATDANPANNPAVVAQLEGAAAAFAKLAPGALESPELALDFSDASVHRLATRLTRARRDAWLAPEPDGTPLVVKVVTHGALYVGACIVKNHGGAWLVRRPTWESLVRLESRAGNAELAPFSWWLKALSDDEIDHGRLGDRYRTYVEVPTFDPASLAPIVAAPRRIPRLAKVRYDSLHRHLLAHVPELKDVGDAFPSPERFAELAFKWLEFVLVGDGRMLVMHGPSAAGVHVFWLDKTGFVKSAYYAADAFPEHKLEADGDKLRVIVSIGGAVRVHETFWWGA